MHYDLYTVLESTAWLYRALGSYPFVLQGPIQSRRYALSTVAVTFTVIFFSISVKYFFDYAVMIKEGYDLEEDSLSVSILCVRQVASIICIFDATILKIANSRQIINSIHDLKSQDEKLQEFGYCFNYKFTTIAGPVVIIPSLMIAYALISTEFLVFLELPISTLLRIFGNTAVLVQVANVTLFCFLILNVGIRFRALNANIENIMSNDTKKVRMSIMQTPSKVVFISAKIHAKLCKIAKNFNRAFVLTLIASTIKAFILSTAMLYYIFISLKYGLQYVGLVNMFLFLAILIVNAVLVIIIVLSCTWTSNQAAATAKILHKISLEKIFIHDEPLNNVIHTFSMQIVHHNFGFSAAGFFPFDPTLLQSLAGAITTYLVILIQFDPKII